MTNFYGPGIPDVLRTSALSGALQISGFDEHNVNAGDHFFIDGHMVIPEAGTVQFTIETPDTETWLHVHYKVESSDRMTFELYKNASGITGGTPLVPVNSNQIISKPSAATVTWSPTVTPGERIGSHRIPMGGGELERPVKLILGQNAAYLWRFVTQQGNTTFNYWVGWSEHVAIRKEE